MVLLSRGGPGSCRDHRSLAGGDTDEAETQGWHTLGQARQLFNDQSFFSVCYRGMLLSAEAAVGFGHPLILQ